jgi:hypothetical protein
VKNETSYQNVNTKSSSLSSTGDDKESVLSVPKHEELDTVNDEVMAVQYASVPVMIMGTEY